MPAAPQVLLFVHLILLFLKFIYLFFFRGGGGGVELLRGRAIRWWSLKVTLLLLGWSNFLFPTNLIPGCGCFIFSPFNSFLIFLFLQCKSSGFGSQHPIYKKSEFCLEVSSPIFPCFLHLLNSVFSCRGM